MSENEQSEVTEYLLEQRCSWVFNPPHSSHIAGTWEHIIGITRRILDSMFLENRYKQLTHEVLVTFMSEVTDIINAWPLVPVSTDPEFPFILKPSMLLTQNTGNLATPQEDFSKKDMLHSQWKRVKALAETFLKRWRKEYLGTLQSRCKCFYKHPNIKEGDIILLKDKQVKRNEWPMGIIVKAVPSSDGVVRKVEVKTVLNGTTKTYQRPIAELVYLLSSDQAVFSPVTVSVNGIFEIPDGECSGFAYLSIFAPPCWLFYSLHFKLVSFSFWGWVNKEQRSTW